MRNTCTTGLQCDFGDRKRGQAPDLGIRLLKPSETSSLFLVAWLIPEREERPGRGKNQGFTGHAIHHGIAAIPPATRAHAVVQKFNRELPAGRSLAWQAGGRDVP